MAYAELFVHLVWATSDRLPLIDPCLEHRLWAQVAAQCRKLKCEPIAVGGMPDHLHLLVAFPPSVAIATIAKEAKGSSSHLMTHELAPASSFKWQDGYSAFTLRKEALETVAHYIAQQKTHHATGAISTSLEHLGGSRLQPTSQM